MAGLLDLFSGRTSDIYGNGLLTPEQRGGLGNIGLLALAGKLGQLAGPSFSPVPDFGAALGQAAGAYGASQEGAGTAALNAILTGQKGRKLQQELDYYQKLGPVLGKLAGDWPGADGGTAATPETGSTGGGAAAPPGAGGGGGGGSDPRGMIPHITAEATRLGIDPAVALQVARSEGLGTFSGDGGKSGGAFQLYTGGGMGNDFQRDTGLNPLDPKNEKATITYALEQAAQKGWGAWNGAKKLGITGFAGIGKPGAAPTAAAPAPAGGGGLLNLPDPTGRAALLGGTPAAAAIAPAAPGVPGASPEDTANSIIKGWTAGAPAPGQGASAAEPPGFAGRQLVAQLLNRPPLDDVSQYRQVAGPGGGEPGGGMASGLLAPGGPLTRGGVPGLPAMPAAAPSADPSLQLGPLAPAPAAAAPAAPGPGLLAPPGMPAAAALPRVNPAFDAYARQLAAAAGLVKGAGLPDALTPLLEAFKGSPGYRAQQIIAEKTAAQPFTQAEDLFKKQVEIAGVGPIEAAKLPYALAQTYFKAEQDIRTAGPVAAAQNFERIRADNAAKGIITTKDADGQIRLSIDPAAVQAVTGATITAPKQAEADIARETKRIEQEQAARYDPMPGGVPVMGADGKTTMMPMSRYEYDLRKRLEAERRGAGGPSSGPQPGDIVGTPYVSKEEEQSREIDLKTLESKRATAESARLAIQNANDVQDLIAKGVVMGPGESVRSGLLKLGYALKLTGKDENDLIANTEAFISRQGSELKDALKGLGPPISNIDVQTAGGIAGGKNVTVQGYLELMKIKEKYNRQVLTEYNDMAVQAPPGRFDRTIKEPPTYGAKTATGPNGQRMWEKSPGNWVPF